MIDDTVAFVPRHEVIERDDKVLAFAEGVEVRLDKRLDDVEGRLTRIEREKLEFKGHLDGRVTEIGLQLERKVDGAVTKFEKLCEKAKPVLDELCGTEEKQAATIDFIKSGTVFKRKKGHYLDIAIRTFIVMTVGGVITFGGSALWEHFVKATREVPAQVTILNQPQQPTHQP